MVGAVVLKCLVLLLVFKGALSLSSSTRSPLPSEPVLLLPSSQSVPPLPSSQSVPPLTSSQSVPPLPSSQSVSPLTSSQSVPPLPSSQFVSPLPSSQPPLPPSQALPTTTPLVLPNPNNQNIAILAGAVGGAGGLVVCVLIIVLVVIVAVALLLRKRKKKIKVLLYQVEDNTVISNPAFSASDPIPSDGQDMQESPTAKPSTKLQRGTFSLIEITVPLTFKATPTQNSNDNTLPEPHNETPPTLVPSEETKASSSEDSHLSEDSKAAVSHHEPQTETPHEQSDDQGLIPVPVPVPALLAPERSKVRQSPGRKAPPPPTQPKPKPTPSGEDLAAVVEPETKPPDPPTENQGVNPVTILDALMSEMSKSKVLHSPSRKPPPPPTHPKPKPVSNIEHLNPSHDKEQTLGGSSALVNNPPTLSHGVVQEPSSQLESAPSLTTQDEPCSGDLTSFYHSDRDTALGKLAEEIEEQVSSTVF